MAELLGKEELTIPSLSSFVSRIDLLIMMKEIFIRKKVKSESVEWLENKLLSL